MDKRELRKQILQIRKSMKDEVRRKKSEHIVKKIIGFSPFQDANCVFSFVPFGDEVDVREVLEEGRAVGKTMSIPKTFVKEKYMAPYEFSNWSELVGGVYGIQEPNPVLHRLVNPEEIDLILVPGVAFDSHGGRLGYGGGFYDRFLGGLSKRPPLVAVCFQEQLVTRIPIESHDIQMDYVITDEFIIQCQP